VGNFWFPGITNKIIKHIKSCDTCQRVRKANIGKLPQRSFEQELKPNKRIHLDTMGPLVTDQGMKYILAITCAFSKYCEIVAMPNKEANTIAQAIFDKWILRYGCPHVVVSDGAPELIERLQSRLYHLLETDKLKTTPHWPKCNGQVEVFNRTIGKYLRSFTDLERMNWCSYLPALGFCYNTGVSKSTQVSPFSLWYAFQPKMVFFDAENPLTRIYDESDEAVILRRLQRTKDFAIKNNITFRESYSKLHDRDAVMAPDFKIGQEVLLHAPWLQTSIKNRKFQHPYIGPFKIQRLDFTKKIVEIKRPRQQFVVNFERIKKYFRPNDNTSSPYRNVTSQGAQEENILRQELFHAAHPRQRPAETHQITRQPLQTTREVDELLPSSANTKSTSETAIEPIASRTRSKSTKKHPVIATIAAEYEYAIQTENTDAPLIPLWRWHFEDGKPFRSYIRLETHKKLNIIAAARGKYGRKRDERCNGCRFERGEGTCYHIFR
jgi:hypothetical protein